MFNSFKIITYKTSHKFGTAGMSLDRIPGLYINIRESLEIINVYDTTPNTYRNILKKVSRDFSGMCI